MLEGTQVAHVKFFRQQIDEYQKIFQQTFFYSASDMIGSSFAVINSKMAMIEAKHWLGWELDRIRKAKEGGTSTQRVLLNE